MVEIRLDRNVLEPNARIAEANRRLLADRGVFALNLIGSPGCGKTTLLETTLRRLAEAGIETGVIEGDLETTRDADRIRSLHVPAVQINTRGGCHLDARQVAGALRDLPLHKMDLLFIENVGNLVCPAEYDLGEAAKIVVLSVTEGHDKPAKYAGVFDTADSVIVSKLDLLAHTDFSLETARADLERIRPGIRIFPLSARTQAGMGPWLEWLRREAGSRASV